MAFKFYNSISFTILLLGPLLGIGAIVFNQSQDVYNSFAKDGNISMLIDSVNDTINNMLPSGVTFDTKQKVSDFILFLSNNIAEIFSSTLSTFFLFLDAFGYFLFS